MTTTLEARLRYLETREEANTNDLLRIKSENVDLRSKVCDLKEVETKCRKLENDLREVLGFKEEIVLRLTKLDANMKHLYDNHDRVSKLETNMNEARQEMMTHNQSVVNRLNALEREQNRQINVKVKHDDTQDEETIPKEVVCGPPVAKPEEAKSVTDRLERIEKQVKDMKEENRLKKFETEVNGIKQDSMRYRQSVTDRLNKNEKQIKDMKRDKDTLKHLEDDVNTIRQETGQYQRSVTYRLDGVAKQTQEIQDGVRAIENKTAQISSSIVDVGLKPKRLSKTGEIMKLDKCVENCTNSRYFDEGSCCLNPQTEGRYVVNVVLLQSGDGEIEMSGIAEGVTGSWYFGRTVGDGDTRSVMNVVNLKKGQKLWLQAIRHNGNPVINFCCIYSWLL